ncbi:MAG: PAS domain S-box protein, partial [Nitrospinota bacterium]
MVRMTVRNRIFAFILGLGTVVFFLFLGVASYKISQVLKENIGEDFHRLAQQMAAKIDLALRKEIDQWRVFAHNDALIEAVERANRRYEGLGPEVVRSEFERIDREWPFSEAYRHFYTPRLNSIDRLLSRYQSLYPEGYAELFVTDGKGALIAATNRTTDYWQADEGWWQIAFSEGRGAVYVGDVEFDDSAQLYAVAVALPVKSRDGTRAVGVLKVILNFHELMGEFAGYRLGRTGYVHILNSRGLDLFESIGMPNRHPSLHKPPGINEVIRRLSVGHLVFKDARGEGFIAGFAPVVPPERLGPATFGGQQLYVLVEQNLEEAYASIYDLVKILLGLGTFVLVAIYLTARLTAKTITDPLDELRRGTQVVRDGDLAHRVELATGDELQELADSFNEMTARLQASYEALEDRVLERTAELEQAVHALEGEITEREQAQKALGETRAFYERLVGEAGDAVVALDWDSALVTWNLGAEKIFGYKAHEVLGKHSGFMVPEEDLERAKAIRQAVLAGQTVRDEVVRRVGKDGVIIDGLATFSPLRNSEGQVVGLCA